MIEIKASFTGKERLVARLNQFEAGVRTRIRSVLKQAALLVAKTAKEKYMRGDPLKRKTGTLSRSVQPSEVIESNSSMSIKVGTNVPYGYVHEYGKKVRQHVRAHMRMSKKSLKAAKRILRQRKQEFGVSAFKGETRQLAQTLGHSVKAFDRTIQFKERPFLRPAFAEVQPIFMMLLRHAIAEEVKKKGSSHA